MTAEQQSETNTQHTKGNNTRENMSHFIQRQTVTSLVIKDLVYEAKAKTSFLRPKPRT